MKAQLVSGLILGLALGAQGARYSWTSSTVDTVIPDNTSAGCLFGGPSGAGEWSPILGSGTISALDVRLNISGYDGGGYKGDLYAYLTYTVAGNSTSLILLNRVGRTGANDAGYSGSVLNVILTGDTSHSYSDIHLMESPAIGGTYLADARTVVPTANFIGATRNSSAGLEFFNNSGLAANGTWSLFLADRAAGDQSQLVSWGLDLTVTPVPEPVDVALGCFAGVALLAGVCRRIKQKAESRKQTFGNAQKLIR